MCSIIGSYGQSTLPAKMQKFQAFLEKYGLFKGLLEVIQELTGADGS